MDQPVPSVEATSTVTESKFSRFAANTEFMLHPLVIYRLADHDIVYANHSGKSFLKKVLVRRDSEHVGNIFAHAHDLRRIESVLEASDTYLMRHVQLGNETRFYCQTIFARLLQFDGAAFVTLIFNKIGTTPP